MCRAVVLLALLAVPAGAQQPPPPARGILGASVGTPAQTLSANGSVGLGTFLTRNRGDRPDFPGAEVSGRQDVLSGGVDYSMSGRRVDFAANVSSIGRRSPDLVDGVMAGHRGLARVAYRPSTRTTLTATLDAAYEPAFERTVQSLLDPDANLSLPGLVDPDRLDDDVFTRRAGVEFRRETSRRGQLTAMYDRSYSTYALDTGDQTQMLDTTGVQYSHQLTPGLSWRLGHRYYRSDFTSDASERVAHTLDAGLDYRRSLQLTRQTAFAFSTGSAFYKTLDSTTQFTLTGDAQLSRQFGRRWTSVLSAARQVGFFQGVTEIVVSNNVSAGLSGQLGDKVTLTVAATATKGQISPGAQANDFVGYGGVSSLSAAFSRAVALSAGYMFNNWEFDREEVLLAIRLSQLHRTWTSLTVRPWTYAGFSLQYSYVESNRDDGDPFSVLRRFDQHSVIASFVVSAPLYTRASRQPQD